MRDKSFLLTEQLVDQLKLSIFKLTEIVSSINRLAMETKFLESNPLDPVNILQSTSTSHVLSLKWNHLTVTFVSREFNGRDSSAPITHGEALSVVYAVYEPVGLVIPSISARILLKDNR